MSKIVDGIVTTAKPLTVITTGITALEQPYGPPDSNTAVHFKKSGLLSHRSVPVLDSVKVSATQAADNIRPLFNHQIIDDIDYFDRALTNMDPAVLSPERCLIVFNITASRTWTLPTSEALILWLKSVYGEDNIYAGMSWEIKFHNRSTDTTGIAVTIADPAGGGLTASRGIKTIITQGSFLTGTDDGTPTVTMRIVLFSVENTLAHPYSYGVYISI